jgi:hypothetical protein
MNQKLHRYDPAFAMFSANWGLVGSTIGVLACVALGFYFSAYDYFSTDGLVGSAFNGLIMIWGGPLCVLTIPAFLGAILWSVVLSRPSLIVFLNLLALQSLNVALSREGSMEWMVIISLLAAVAADIFVLRTKPKTEPNQSLQTTTMAVTDAAAQPPRQP